tara:strand:+ start:8924 stop:9655 length:732 start_codon:yes stop_codon:yes gene_type:complete
MGGYLLKSNLSKHFPFNEDVLERIPGEVVDRILTFNVSNVLEDNVPVLRDFFNCNPSLVKDEKDGIKVLGEFLVDKFVEWASTIGVLDAISIKEGKPDERVQTENYRFCFKYDGRRIIVRDINREHTSEYSRVFTLKKDNIVEVASVRLELGEDPRILKTRDLMRASRHLVPQSTQMSFLYVMNYDSFRKAVKNPTFPDPSQSHFDPIHYLRHSEKHRLLVVSRHYEGFQKFLQNLYTPELMK